MTTAVIYRVTLQEQTHDEDGKACNAILTETFVAHDDLMAQLDAMGIRPADRTYTDATAQCGRGHFVKWEVQLTEDTRPITLTATHIVNDIVLAVNDIPANSVQCEWFFKCEYTATHFETHPVLTYVPACDKCPKVGR